jgi:hypothetical protein
MKGGKTRTESRERERGKLEERDSVCECNSLMLSDSGECSHCRGKRGSETERAARAEKEIDEGERECERKMTSAFFPRKRRFSPPPFLLSSCGSQYKM